MNLSKNNKITAPTVAEISDPSNPPVFTPSQPKRKPPINAPMTPIIRSSTQPEPRPFDQVSCQPTRCQSDQEEQEDIHVPSLRLRPTPRRERAGRRSDSHDDLIGRNHDSEFRVASTRDATTRCRRSQVSFRPRPRDAMSGTNPASSQTCRSTEPRHLPDSEESRKTFKFSSGESERRSIDAESSELTTDGTRCDEDSRVRPCWLSERAGLDAVSLCQKFGEI